MLKLFLSRVIKWPRLLPAPMCPILCQRMQAVSCQEQQQSESPRDEYTGKSGN